MEWIAFMMRVKPGQEPEYRRRHLRVWPEMLQALKDAGCSNYSIFMKGDDLFAYLEVTDFERFKQRMAASADTHRWEGVHGGDNGPRHPARGGPSTRCCRRCSTLTERRTRGTDERLIERINALRVETPSWGYGNSGTRFKVFAQPGAARNIEEKLADAGMVNRLTRICPTVAIHIPWDRVDDWPALRQSAAGHGVSIGAINPNLFQDDEYMLGSLCNPSVAVRRRSLEHVRECIVIARAVGSSTLSLWLADGTNYPGQDDLRARRQRLVECLQEIYSWLPPGLRLLVEYKFFEPGFYSTDLPDWGSAYTVCLELGPQAEVLVDTGHHAQGVNVEQIVAHLLDRGRLGGFHFNARRYADDDLIVGSANPYELFLIFHEMVSAEEDDDQNVARCARQVAYMVDQSHNIEPKLEAMVQSVVNIQIAHAKALLVDRPRLKQAQAAGDVLEANRVLLEAYESDVRPLLVEARMRLGIDPDPIAALRRSGYPEQVARERGKGAAGSGYPGA